MPYIAPEVLAKKGDYDPRPLDVWSCAIVFMTMTYGGAPWSAASKEGQGYARFQQGWDAWLAEHPDGVVRDEKGGFPKCGPLFDRLDSPAIRRLMLKMLHPLPEKRIGVAQALGSPIMRLVECCSPESYEERSGCVVDACKKGQAKSAAKMVQRKHSHLPPTEHRTPKFFQHRFDMGDGWS
ncbi:hypothetical protein BDY21DRAFT_353240 [Lineolata rhizophorae]|uniref:non-specific serine/threonine protein kinase n=1 Tax=Lineolata rhizophorae TaxID=578093 RepID=A0A6A6NR30_9PEZI|nr:hypothetical protein BDY21DRAFT_353240 [Lineolata rhizophorae]